MQGYYLENFGCRATQADGAAIERGLQERGLKPAPDAVSAEVVVLNSCTVTAAADHDLRAAVRRVKRKNPDCKILVTGCYAQRAPEEVASLPGVSWVVGNSHKHQVAEVAMQGLVAAGNAYSNGNAGSGFVPLNRLAPATAMSDTLGRVTIGDIFAHTELMAAPVFDAEVSSEKTRPNLKVQDGCDNRCSFCIIPFVRGQSRSLALAQVVKEVDALVAAGYREIVLSGINLGRWGRDFEPACSENRFPAMLREVLRRTAIEKIRISSVEPMDWTDELIELVASEPRIAKHAHVPLQSGSDRILRLMHRRYRPWHYREKIEKISAAMPDAAIGADVMVGFPGETDELFEESRAFIASLPFTYLHVFTYSSRPGTPSATMPDQVPVQVARERNRVLRELGEKKNFTFWTNLMGRRLSAITLQTSDFGATEALTDNYLEVLLDNEYSANTWVHIEIVNPLNRTARVISE